MTNPVDLQSAVVRRATAAAVALLLAAGLTAAREVSPRDKAGADLSAGAEGGPTGQDGGTAGTLPIAEPSAGAAAAIAGGGQSGGTRGGGKGGAGGTVAGGGAAGASAQSTKAKLPAERRVRGVNDDTIQLGLTNLDYSTSAAAVNAIAGSNVDSGSNNPAKRNAVLVEHINATGGIAGRKVQPVYYFYDVARYFTPSSRQQANQEACATWTEDHQVFAYNGAAFSEELMLDCARKSGTVMVSTLYHPYPSQGRFQSMADLWYSPDNFLAERRERSTALFLAKHGFFTPNAKVAVMIEDKPGIREGVKRSLLPTLAQLGISAPMEILYPDMVESPWPNYALQMKTNNVTHVLFAASTQPAFAAFFMMKAADDQSFVPQWGGGSDTGANALEVLGAPRRQLANFRAMGWEPQYFDTGETKPVSPTAEACFQVMKKAGSSETDHKAVCEFLLFLRAAFDKADVLSPRGLATGVGRLGDSYVSALTVSGATRFAPGRHDGVSVARVVRWDSGCDCMRYTTPPEPVPE